MCFYYKIMIFFSLMCIQSKKLFSGLWEIVNKLDATELKCPTSFGHKNEC